MLVRFGASREGLRCRAWFWDESHDRIWGWARGDTDWTPCMRTNSMYPRIASVAKGDLDFDV